MKMLVLSCAQDKRGRLARAAGLLGALLMLAGCGTSNGVLQAYPANAGYNAVSTIETGRIREITLWKPPTTAQGVQPLRVAVWCEPHLLREAQQSQQAGFSAGSCAFNILLEDYAPVVPVTAVSPPPPKTPVVATMTPLAEQFSECSEAANAEACRQKRNVLQSFLLKTAHANCLSYLRRVFAAKELGDTTVSVLKDTLTGGSVVGAAAGSPPVAGALGLLNLLTGTYSKVDTAMFQGATARVLADAIEQAQNDYLAAPASEGTARKCTPAGTSGASYDQCDVFELLEFANAYASACSLRHGLGILEAKVTTTKAQKTAAEAAAAAQDAVKKVSEARAADESLRTEVQKLPAITQKTNETAAAVEQLKATVNSLATKVNAPPPAPITITTPIENK